MKEVNKFKFLSFSFQFFITEMEKKIIFSKKKRKIIWKKKYKEKKIDWQLLKFSPENK